MSKTITKKLLSSTGVVVMCAGLFAASASAQTIDDKVYFTFSGAVEVPGAALKPGKYLFHLTDPSTTRAVVQVMSADGKRVYSQFFTRRIDRPTASDNAEVRLTEVAAGTAPAIKTMWYPGLRSGREFVYPKRQAREIARRTHESVLTTRVESTKPEETKTGDLAVVSPAGEDTNASDTAEAAAPTGFAQVADVAPASTQAPVTTLAEARTELPRTASELPLVLLLGVSLLAAALALHAFRTRRS